MPPRKGRKTSSSATSTTVADLKETVLGNTTEEIRTFQTAAEKRSLKTVGLFGTRFYGAQVDKNMLKGFASNNFDDFFRDRDDLIVKITATDKREHYFVGVPAEVILEMASEPESPTISTIDILSRSAIVPSTEEKMDGSDKELLQPQFFDASTPQEIGAALKALREEEGLTQDQVAERMGTDRSNIIRIEKGRSNITGDTIRKFAEATGNKPILGFRPI
ncbi:MAG: helix-turn-helix transcriptional regulator [Pseudomonadota bacterium]